MPLPTSTAPPSATPTAPAATATTTPIPATPTAICPGAPGCPFEAPPTPANEALAELRSTVRQGSTAALPEYYLDLRVDPASGTLSGRETIVVPNATGQPLADIVVRLYPNYPEDVFGQGGDIELTLGRAQVDGVRVEPALEQQRTAARLSLPSPLQPGASATVELAFEATFKPFSRADASLLLASYYPMLAIFEDGQWRTDISSFPDKVYADAALYAASVTAPADLTVVTSGVEVESVPEGDLLRHEIVAGPVREWALTLGRLELHQDVAGETVVNVYQQRGMGFDALRIARVAVAALNSFEQRFGPYPYSELDLHLLPSTLDAGTEYPGLVLIEVDGWVKGDTDFVVAHEVAHQWWYGVVGNDIFNEPWIDEALSQYSAVIAALDRAGPEAQRATYDEYVGTLVGRCEGRGSPPVGLSVWDYQDFSMYYCAVYGRGAAFVDALRRELGDEAFFGGLQLFYREQRHGIATRADLLSALERSSGRSLAPLFEAWLG